MKQRKKLSSVLRCLFCASRRDRSPDSDTRMLILSSSSSTDSIFKISTDEGSRGFTNSVCDGGGQKSVPKSECVVECSLSSSPLSSFSVLADHVRPSTMPGSWQGTPSSCLSSSSKFVFIVAADMEETDRLDDQVSTLCEALKAQGIGYVVVRSTSQQPLVCLPQSLLERLPQLAEDFRSVQTFVWKSYKMAAKVLMVITPGYLRYADADTEGADEARSSQQKLMRKIQEKLKREFFDRVVPFRIWPVLLHELKANRLHVPLFLSKSLFYWFPCRHNTENLVQVLRNDLRQV